MDMTKEALEAGLAACHLPPYMWESTIAYILDGRPIGHFLSAIVNNDLKAACDRADFENSVRIYHWVKFFYNYTPQSCWGRSDARDQWVAHKGYNGLIKQDTCNHDWQEQPGEPPVDVCPKCGAVRR